MISICRTDQGVQLRVNILNDRLASELGAGNVFFVTKGEQNLRPANTQENKLRPLHLTVQQSLQRYLDHHKNILYENSEM